MKNSRGGGGGLCNIVKEYIYIGNSSTIYLACTCTNTLLCS